MTWIDDDMTTWHDMTTWIDDASQDANSMWRVKWWQHFAAWSEWHDALRYDVVQFEATWCDTTCRDLTRQDVTRHVATSFDVTSNTVWHGGRVVEVLASICVWTEQTQVRILLRTLFGYKARSIVTGPTRPSSLEAGSYTGYQAELNIKARPGRVSSSGARVTMQEIPERYENS